MELIITVVNRGYADMVMDAARSKGAKGGTIINGRGTGTKEAEKFFNIVIQPEKEVVLILVDSAICQLVMEEIRTSSGLNTAGHGIAFSLPVDDAVGLTSFEEKAE